MVIQQMKVIYNNVEEWQREEPEMAAGYKTVSIMGRGDGTIVVEYEVENGQKR